MITIKELADHLGISISTVSKALNNYNDISEETRERVFKAVEQLGYFPSHTARNFRRKKTEKIGFTLYSAYTNYQYVSDFYFEMMRGAGNAAEKEDYNLVLYTSIAPQPDRILRICQAREVDGMILMAGGIDLSSQAELLLAKKMPFVVLHTGINKQGISFVEPDNVTGGFLATQHLIELGHKRIAYLGSVHNKTENQARFVGYVKALEKFGVPFNERLVRNVSLHESDIRRAVEELLGQSERPSAIFAYNDHRAIYAMKVFAEQHLQVPEDIAIVGFDDANSAISTIPPLTTVHQPFFELGSRATEILLFQLTSGNLTPVHEVLPVELVVRNSTVI